MRLTVVGAGYVGLTLALVLTELGHTVTCVERDPDRIAALNHGHLPFVEPGLTALLIHGQALQTLRFVRFEDWAGWRDEAIFVCVGTPVDGQGRLDQGPLQQVCQHIAAFASQPQTVIVRSTIEPGTTVHLQALLNERSTHAHQVAHMPEFLRQGQALQDCRQPARVIVGTQAPQVLEPLLKQVFHTLEDTPWFVVSAAEAELAKLAANSYLATKISWANELATLCGRAGVNAHSVLSMAGADPRIGSWGLQTGIGFGGSCLPKDTQALIKLAQDHGLNALMLEAALQRNQQQAMELLTQLRQALGQSDWQGVRLGIWGVSFKGDTDDLRESPGLAIVEYLLAQGAQLVVHQPMGLEKVQAVLGNRVTYADTAIRACQQAEALLVLSDWQDYERANWDEVAATLHKPLVVDGRGILDAPTLVRYGLTRLALGQPQPQTPTAANAVAPIQPKPVEGMPS